MSESGTMTCPLCDGTGDHEPGGTDYEGNRFVVSCPRCYGRGSVQAFQHDERWALSFDELYEASSRSGLPNCDWLLGWLCGRHGLHSTDIKTRFYAAYQINKRRLDFSAALVVAALDLDVVLLVQDGGESDV